MGLSLRIFSFTPYSFYFLSNFLYLTKFVHYSFYSVQKSQKFLRLDFDAKELIEEVFLREKRTFLIFCQNKKNFWWVRRNKKILDDSKQRIF